MTQNAKLLAYLESHDGITTFEATLNLGICRLSERVREIERLGFNISHDPETVNGHHFIRYRLVEHYAYG
jgi:hypothetical protein